MRVMSLTIFAILFSLAVPALADAPVVDDGENFALLEEKLQAAEELPVAQDDVSNLEDVVTQPVTHKYKNTTAGNTDLVNKIQSLQKEIQELRGQLEVQAHYLDELKQQQPNFSQDNQASPNAVLPAEQQATAEHANAAMGPPALEMEVQPMQHVERTNSAARINPADEQISYLAAYDLVKQKNFPQATQAMEQFLTKYPHGGYSANAHYWLGELYLEKKDYTNAVTQFNTVIQSFQTSSKYAPSRLKLGYALADSGRIAEAKEQLKVVINQYPDTNAAQLAHQKLEKLGG